MSVYAKPAPIVAGQTAVDSWANSVVTAFGAISDARLTYTPALTATGVAVVLGTGSVQEGRYILLDKGLCICQIGVQWGSSGSTFSTGTYSISLPVAAPRVSAMTLSPVGEGFVYDASATTPFAVKVLRDTATTVTMRNVGLNSFVTNAAPMTFAASDGFYLNLLYEVA